MRPQAGPATMTSTLIMTTGIDRGDGVSTRGNRFVEPLDMSNFSECTLQVPEMQDGDGIRKVNAGICEGGALAICFVASGLPCSKPVDRAKLFACPIARSMLK